MWVDGPRAREDVAVAGGERRRILRTDGKVFDCVEADGGWSCAERSEAPEGVRGRLSRLVPEVAGVAVVERADTVAGLEVRCFDVASPDAPVQICLTGDGVLARLAVGDERLELIGLEREVEAGAFALPGRA